MRVMTKEFFKTGFVKLTRPHMIYDNLRLARGHFRGDWEKTLFPHDQPEKGAPTIRWSRTVLTGHGLIFLISLGLGFAFSPAWFLVPVLVSLTPHYGGWLFFLCNNTQHIGLQDDVDDFRLCCRSFTTNPVVQFLYWHMNYHIEHHMYAAVPCYNLGKLHRAIEHELPPTPHGLIATWKEIAAIQRQQEQDPTYQYIAPIPAY
jgi:fatty acid desaturase